MNWGRFNKLEQRDLGQPVPDARRNGGALWSAAACRRFGFRGSLLPRPTMKWPHSPLHILSETGAYMVTAATFRKMGLFNSGERLTLFTEHLCALSAEYGWQLQAWAVFPNHYHFVAVAPPKIESLGSLIRHLHSVAAITVNRMDREAGRKVWFQYWETHLTYEKSFFTRLHYVHSNAVHHGLVQEARRYPWCSAGWFQQEAGRSFHARIMGLRSDRISVPDDFNVRMDWWQA